MSQLASKYDCENTQQLVASLVVRWGLERATDELFTEVKRIEESGLSLKEKLIQLNVLHNKFQT